MEENNTSDPNIELSVELKNMDFGWALHYIRYVQNGKVRRAGWNGKGMFILMAGGYSVASDKLRPGTAITAEFLASRGCSEMKIIPHVDMWSAQNEYVSGWLASQADMFANDWELAD